MSFTAEVKKELIRHHTKYVHCRKAELAALICLAASEEDGIQQLVLEDEELAKKCCAAIRKWTGKESEIFRKKQSYCLPVDRVEDVDSLLEKNCCKRAFLRGAFIASGMISDPEKNYHFEIRCADRNMAEYLQETAACFGISSKISKRRERFLLYIKEGVEIADMLNVMEAHVALMAFENARIVKEVRGNINRKVNCEAANIGKTINAAMKQIDEITYIRDTVGLDVLGAGLKELAQARLDNPDMPLSRLGQLLDPPVGKSGINHRFRKLTKIAEELKHGNKGN